MRGTQNGVSAGEGSELEVRIKVGSRIRDIRVEKGLTHTQLAELCGIQPDCMAEIETGKADADILDLLNIAKNLGTTIQSLLDGIC